MPLTFATPLPQSCRSEILEWRFPRPYHNLVLTGRSRAAWHTSFVVPQLDILLDAGLCVNKLRPKQVFLTHGHSDHTLVTSVFVSKEDPPDIYCPAEMETALNNSLNAQSLLDLGGLVGARGDSTTTATDGGDVHGGTEPTSTPSTGSGLPPTHRLHGVYPGQIMPLPRTKDWTVTVFRCDHTVPCVGYVFHSVAQKLKPEYTVLPGPEIAKLRASGVDITYSRSHPVFAFLGDTTAEVLDAAPEWLRQGIPVVITECSFLHDEHRPQADKTKHTLWADLDNIIRRWPRTTFVLTHFSLRYTEADIRQFFRRLPDPPSNVVLWIDGSDEP